MAISRKQLLAELLPALDTLFGKEYNALRPIDMLQTGKDDIENKALIGATVDVLLGLWYAVFPDGIASSGELFNGNSDLRDIGRLLRNAHLLKYNTQDRQYYIEEKV